MSTTRTSLRSIQSGTLPKPIGPFSHAIAVGNLLMVSGQLGIDPTTGKVPGPDAAAQTTQCLANIQSVLAAAGLGLEHVMRCGVFMTDLKQFSKMNEAYAKAFGDHRPARTTIQAAALPGDGAVVEVDCIAWIP